MTPANTYDELRRELSVILLGPGDADPDAKKKREDIGDALREAGFSSTQLGEDVIGDDSIYPLHLALHPVLDDIDLILALDSGPAPLAELATLSMVPRARRITRVWCERQHLERRTVPSDVVAMFPYHVYDLEEISACTLIESFLHQTNMFVWSRADELGILPSLQLNPPSPAQADDVDQRRAESPDQGRQPEL